MKSLVLENVRNSCFINSTLQMLYEVDEFRQFILSLGISENSQTKYPICSALNKLFVNERKQNANHLRYTMAFLDQECAMYDDGTMHDAEEFLVSLFKLLEIELSISPPGMQILDLFRGTYITGRKFIGSQDGSCVNCRNFPGSESLETFFFLNLNMPDMRNQSLSDLIQNEFTQPSDRYTAKCSSCCRCVPGQGCVCPQREVADVKTLITGPKYLLVKLLRYNSRGEKNTCFIPSMDFFKFDNQDQTYAIQCIMDHIGLSVNAGHWILHKKDNERWQTCNDDRLVHGRTDKSVKSNNNTIFCYATQGQKNFPIAKPQGTQTMKSSNANLKEQIISSNPSYISNSKKTAEKPKTLCKVCKREFERIVAHYSRSPSCKPGPELQADQMSKKCDSARNLDLIKDKKSATNPQSEKKTQIDEINNAVVTERIEPTVKDSKRTQCQGCGKEFVRIFSHFNKSPQCKSKNDLVLLELAEKEKRKLSKTKQMAKARSLATPEQREKDREVNREQKAKARSLATPEQREKDIGASRVLMAKARSLATPEQREKDREVNREQKAKARSLATPEQREKDREVNREQKAKARSLATPEQREKDMGARRVLMAKARSLATPEQREKDREVDRDQRAKARSFLSSTAEGRRKLFYRAVKYGPIFVCICCHRKLFETSVKAITDMDSYMMMLDSVNTDLFDNAIGAESLRNSFFINDHYNMCFTCEKYLLKGKIPPMSNQNHLKVFDEYHPSYLRKYEYLKNMSELENTMTAGNIPYMKVYTLPKSRYSGFKDRLINIPVELDDIRHTINSLPRTPTEAGIVPVRLKRKMGYKNYHIQENISVPKIIQAVKDYKGLGHRFYQNFPLDEIERFRSRCEVTDPDLIDGLFDLDEGGFDEVGDESDTLMESLESLPVGENVEIDVEDELEKDLENYLRNDPVAKFQFDYNRSTCLGNDVPEISAPDINDIISIAPGEGKIPKSLLSDPDWDMKSHPCLDPTGENHMSRERPVKLSNQKFFEQRLLNADTRFANNKSYVFAATQYCERKQLSDRVNISFLRGNAQRNEDGHLTYTLNDPCAVFDNIKNTPRYWKKKKDELISKLENLGPFHFFFTLSCADTRYEENFTSLLTDHNIIYKNIKGRERAFVIQNGIEMSLNDFLSQNVSKHEFIRKNVLTATRNFNNRVKQFIKNIVMSKGSPMCVQYYNYRIEFQLRGAGHLHGVLWIDLDEIIKRMSKKKGFEHFKELKKAFDAVNNDEKPTEVQYEVLQDFHDLFISCSTKSPGGKIASEVNKHHHTHTCKKHGTECRFDFPRLISPRTVLSVPIQILYPDIKDREEVATKQEKVFGKVKELLQNEEKMKEICKLYQTEIESFLSELDNLEEDEELDFMKSKEEELKIFRERRIIEVLKHAGIMEDLSIDTSLPDNIKDYQMLEEYVDLLKVSRKGYSMICARDIDEIFINNYNEEWIRAWDSNMDIQMTMTFFAIITYITDYYMKDDSGTMEFLKAAIKDSENQPLRDRLKFLINIFLTHRQMGEPEAFYRLLPSLHLADSNIGTIFVHTGFKKSRFLKCLTPFEAKKVNKARLITLENNSEQYYIENPSIRDKYLRRPEVLENITLSQFAKIYCPRQISNDENANIVETTYRDCPPENRIQDRFIISPIQMERSGLPDLVKLNGDPVPGELNFLKLRRPIALRYHKFKETNDPHQFFFSEMELYVPFRSEDELFPEDFESCEQKYRECFPSIQYRKSKIMEFLQVVEEGRENAQDLINEETAASLDNENVQDNAESLEQGISQVEQFIAMDPSDINTNEDDPSSSEGFYKRIEIQDEKLLRERTDNLDSDQKLVIDIGITYAKGIVKFRTGNSNIPEQPLLAVQGGAGSGKSHVIDILAQWIEFILRSSGDNPDHPYVLKCAFAGTAAAKINGQTLTSAFNLGFGNKYRSLPDKSRDLKRGLLSNLAMLIVDEYSMLKADMLYQLHLRLQEIKQRYDLPFGGCSVILVGDLLQLPPVRGKYPFQCPYEKEYHIAHALSPLWDNFKPILLRQNHRQGEDKTLADILNRISRGLQTKDDLEILSTKIISKNNPSIPDDAVYIFSINADVNEQNTLFLGNLDEDEIVLNATVKHSTMKNFKPFVERDGSIKGTPLQNKLIVKKGAEVMLTHNVDTCDGLTNGAFGKIFGFSYHPNNTIKHILVEFYNENVGKNKRKKFPQYEAQYPGRKVTAIGLHESHYNIQNNFSTSGSKALAINFPLKLSFAVTSHKVQGQSISKPKKVVIDLKRANFAGQAHVMLSRVECMDQLMILDQLYEEKWKVSKDALEEVERMEKNALNLEVFFSPESTNITSMNIRSLSNLVHFKADNSIHESNIILLQETWHNLNDHPKIIEGFIGSFNSGTVSRGNGIATFYKDYETELESIWHQSYQITKVSTSQHDIFNIYFKNRSAEEFLADLKGLINNYERTVILGDFNIDYNKKSNNNILKWFEANDFIQIQSSPTHLKGGLIDHVWIPKSMTPAVRLKSKSVFYSDHDLVQLSIH